ncbi:uncharacterized protein LODBEIA_P58530 [Lodderomyces beijingensis]|uniref:Uncharacterized protein n=1 Tax=Lodderomyces beijingensis TaxID=1775926 RepID=A0ABP0ZUQ2_9ASCO
MLAFLEARDGETPIGVTPPDSAPADPNPPTAYLRPRYLPLLVLVALCIVIYIYRHRIAEFHDRYRTYRRMRQSNFLADTTFEDDLADGLSSLNFDLESHNIDSGDSRKGLSAEARADIKRIMKSRGVSFDEARLEYTRGQFRQHGIDETGLPRDPKLVTL